MQQNLRMLQNVLEPLAGAAPLRHVTIMQGTKAYGGHVHVTTLPHVEDAPRDPHPNFYWLHEDFLRDIAARQGWAWTIFRPQIVLGGAYGVVMNAIPVIGAYAAICREEGVPCGYPGAHTLISEAVDARLVAQACAWAATSAQAANQTFNIANGDLWVLSHQWQAICGLLGVEAGPPRPFDFAHFAEEKSDVWDRVVRKFNLRPISLKDLIGESHHLMNMIVGNGMPSAPTVPTVVSTIKIRQAGFGACMHTIDSMRYWFGWFARRRILPPVPAL
jgi:nucleoside-diphosphate-sugar epimerase